MSKKQSLNSDQSRTSIQRSSEINKFKWNRQNQYILICYIALSTSSGIDFGPLDHYAMDCGYCGLLTAPFLLRSWHVCECHLSSLIFSINTMVGNLIHISSCQNYSPDVSHGLGVWLRRPRLGFSVSLLLTVCLLCCVQPDFSICVGVFLPVLWRVPCAYRDMIYVSVSICSQWKQLK